MGNKSTQCMQEREHLSSPCARCYGESIACTYHHCQQECACSPAPPRNSRECKTCVRRNCQAALHWCSGVPTAATDFVFDTSLLNADEGESLPTALMYINVSPRGCKPLAF